MEPIENILKTAADNQKRAWQAIEQSGVIRCWESIGAKVNLVGSLKTGLLMKNRDIDFHIYTPQMKIGDSFRAMAQLAENPNIVKIEYVNLLQEADTCLEWHAWYRDERNLLWQLDMIHMPAGSPYDGYFEKIAERIAAVITPEQRTAILQLKFETPDELKIAGIEYYLAVIRDGIRNYADFDRWRQQNPLNGIVEWMT